MLELDVGPFFKGLFFLIRQSFSVTQFYKLQFQLNKSQVVFSLEVHLKPIGLPLPSEREYGTFKAMGDGCHAHPHSSLLPDVDKPTIWLETTAVELYGMDPFSITHLIFKAEIRKI